MARYCDHELLHAVRGPCQRRGFRCTDAEGTGKLLLFERI